MDGISFNMIIGALLEMATMHASLLFVIAGVVCAQIVALVLRSRRGNLRMRQALRWSIGTGIAGTLVVGFGLLALTKSGFENLHGWLDYTAWLVPTVGLAIGLGIMSLPGFAALSARK